MFEGGGFPEEIPPIEAATVFSAAGDVFAISDVNTFAPPHKFRVRLSSPSAGVGRLRSLPIAQFSIPVTAKLTVGIGEGSYFFGPEGKYSVTVTPGGAEVGGELSVQRVTPTGSTGILPAGSVLRIVGTGFNDGTAVTVDGVSLSKVEVLAPGLIHATLAAPAEITGKLIRVRNAEGAQIDYWGGMIESLFMSPFFETFPLTATHSGACREAEGHPGFSDPLHLDLQNPNLEEAQVTITNTVSLENPEPSTVTVMIPSGGVVSVNLDDPPKSEFQTDPSTPVRVLCLARSRSPDFSLLTWLPVFLDEPIPFIGWAANAASQSQAAVSPGEIITVYGVAAGPSTPAGLLVDDSDRVTTNLSGIRLLFDGVPSPLLFASNSQVNAVVPYEIGSNGVARVELEYDGVRSAAWGVPVMPAAPGIFTLAMTGQGQAAVLNRNHSLNGPSNPAERGTVVQIFATGEGLTTPDGVTGGIAGKPPNLPRLPVAVSIGGMDAPVRYAGSSSGSVAGLLQVNALVPLAVSPGDAVPLSLTIGTATSPAGPTIAVR